MRKISFFLCCVLLLQILCSCSVRKEEFENPVNFYYCRREISYNSPQAVLEPEVREGKSYHGNLFAYLHSYLYGPVSQELETLIPSGVYLVSCSVDDGVADIMFSSQFSKLSGIELTTACSGVLLSLHEFADVNAVRITAKDAQLDDKDIFELSLDDIVLLDEVIRKD